MAVQTSSSTQSARSASVLAPCLLTPSACSSRRGLLARDLILAAPALEEVLRRNRREGETGDAWGSGPRLRRGRRAAGNGAPRQAGAGAGASTMSMSSAVAYVSASCAPSAPLGGSTSNVLASVQHSFFIPSHTLMILPFRCSSVPFGGYM